MRRISKYIVIFTTAAGVVFGQCNVTAAEEDTWISSEYVAYTIEIGEEFSICPELLQALIESESSGNPYAHSDKDAYGLCQIRAKYSKYSAEELTDAYTNIYAAAEILTDLSNRYPDMCDCLVAYHTGEYSSYFKSIEGTGEGLNDPYASKILTRCYVLEEVHGKHGAVRTD